MRLLLNVLWFIFGGWISGTLWLIANPVYMNWTMSNECNQTPR